MLPSDVSEIVVALVPDDLHFVVVCAQELFALGPSTIYASDASASEGPTDVHAERWDAAWAVALTDYVRVAAVSLGAMRLSVFAHASVRHEVSDVERDVVACGLGGVLANKGCAAVRLALRGQTMLFVNAHMCAHQKKVSKRNADFHRAEHGATPPISREKHSWKTERKRVGRGKVKEIHLEALVSARERERENIPHAAHRYQLWPVHGAAATRGRYGRVSRRARCRILHLLLGQ